MNLQKKKNIIIADHVDWLEVDISSPKYPSAIMKINREDYSYISSIGGGRFCPTRTNDSASLYAVVTIDKKNYRVHRVLLSGYAVVDHINGNGLDNRRGNLRQCTHSQNSSNSGIRINNSSGCTGVYFHKSSQRWISRIRAGGKRIYLGKFKNKQEAILARTEAEQKYLGQFAPLRRKSNNINHAETSLVVNK